MRDSAKLFGDRLDICLRECGFVPSIWDPKLYIYDNIPGIPADAPILERLKQSFKGGWHDKRPIGYMAIAQHVDDGIAIASNGEIAQWVVKQLSKIWPTTMTRWRKVLHWATAHSSVSVHGRCCLVAVSISPNVSPRARGCLGRRSPARASVLPLFSVNSCYLCCRIAHACSLLRCSGRLRC